MVDVLNHRYHKICVKYLLEFQTNLNILFSCIGSKKQFLPALDGKKGSEEILNAILPPREYIETGK